MDEIVDTTLHHVFLLCLQVAILISLFGPYLAAHRERRLGEYITDKSWGFSRFIGDLAVVCLFVFHLFIWAQEPTSPISLVPKILALFYGWTAMMTCWAVYSHKKLKSAAQKNCEIRS